MARLSPEDHALVTAAVAAAELKSDGEIVTIVAGRSDAYHDVALHYSILAMLLVPAFLALLPQGWIDWIEGLTLGWNSDFNRPALMVALFVLLSLVFLLVRLLLASMAVRMALTPGRTKSRRVHRQAIALFRSACELKTLGRTGILIYLSLAEHRAEIVADEAIASEVDPDVWGEAMEVMIDEVKSGRPGAGMAAAVEKVGAVLARVVPKADQNPNELPDRLIEL